MRKTLIFVIIFLCCIASAFAVSNVRIQPNVSASGNNYFYTKISNLTVYYDGSVQDFAGYILFNGVRNVTIPQSIARWTFDVDSKTHVIDSSHWQKHYDGNTTASAWVENPRVWYHDTGGVVNPYYCDDGNT
jgi:hypothetical protein